MGAESPHFRSCVAIAIQKRPEYFDQTKKQGGDPQHPAFPSTVLKNEPIEVAIANTFGKNYAVWKLPPSLCGNHRHATPAPTLSYGCELGSTNSVVVRQSMVSQLRPMLPDIAIATRLSITTGD